MKKTYSKNSRQGLPGGPNEMFEKVKGIIVSQRGQWDFPGMNTLVPTDDGRITMRGVPYPVYGQDETGYGQMMYPGQEYQFPGNNVLELPMAQVGLQKKLQPWEYLDKDGGLHTDVDLLPNDPQAAQKYAEELNWMRNWILNRQSQMQSAIKSYMSRQDEKHPVNALAREYIFSPLFGEPSAYGLSNDWGTTNQELGKNILNNAVKNVNRLKFKDSSKVNPESYVPSAWGTYSPYNHSIHFLGQYPSGDTKIHEIGHGTRLAKEKVFQDVIQHNLKNDPIYKSNYDDYYHSPEEIYSRIWEIRKGLNLKPTDKVTKELLKKKLNENKNSEEYIDLFKYLKPDTIVNLLNELVYQESDSQLPMAQRGLYVDPNDPAGRKRYKAYQDSLQLYNRYLDLHNAAYFSTNPRTRSTVARRYGFSYNPSSRMFTLNGVGREQLPMNTNNVNSNIFPIAGWSYADPYQASGVSEFLAEYKQPVEIVKYKLDPEIVKKQKLLKEAGLYKGKIDGVWGTSSQKAWDNYQKQFNVEPTPNENFDKVSTFNRSTARQYISQMQFRDPLSRETEERFRLVTPLHEYIMNQDQYRKLLPTDSIPKDGNFLYRINRTPANNLKKYGGDLKKFQRGEQTDEQTNDTPDSDDNKTYGTYYIPEYEISDLNLPIYKTPRAFYERNKHLQTYFSEKDISKGVHSSSYYDNLSGYTPKIGNNPLLLQRDFSDDENNSWYTDNIPEFVHCNEEGCTARANRFISSFFTSGSPYFQNPDKTKEYLGATFSAERPPTRDEIKRYPYAEGDKIVSLDAWDQVDAAMRTMPGNVLYSNIYVPKNGKITQADINAVARKNIGAGEIWKKYKVPLGSIINVGGYPQNPIYTDRKIIAGTHTVRVVGYTDTGEPLIADYGEVRPLSQNMYGPNAYVAGIITVPGNENFTYDYFVEKAKLKNAPGEKADYYIKDITDSKNVGNPLNPLRVFDSKKYSEEFVNFNNSIIDEANKLRSKLNISKEKYDQYAKIALTIAGTETDFGKGLFYNLLDFGESTGITQLNKKNIEDKYQKTLSAYTKGTTAYDAVATILYIKELDKYKEKWSKMGSKAQERPFTMKEGYGIKAQLKKDIRKLQGKEPYGYEQSGGIGNADTFTDEKGIVKLPFKQPWQSEEDFTKEVNEKLRELGREDLRFAFKDGKRTIFRTTLGNTIPNDLEDMIFYSWQSPSAYIYGDAQGNSQYYRKAKRIYGELFPTPKKQLGGALPQFQKLGQFNPELARPNPLTGKYKWEDKKRNTILTNPNIPKIPVKSVPKKEIGNHWVKNWQAPDSFEENFLEVFDPLGYLSYDDARRADSTFKASGRTYPTFDETLDMSGVLPGLLSKVKYLKALKYPQRITNLFDAGTDIIDDNLLQNPPSRVYPYKNGGSLPKAQILGQFNPKLFQPNPITGLYNWEKPKVKPKLSDFEPKQKAAPRSSTSVATKQDPVKAARQINAAAAEEYERNRQGVIRATNRPVSVFRPGAGDPEAIMEFMGVPGAVRFARNPVQGVKGFGNTIVDLGMTLGPIATMNPATGYEYATQGINPLTGEGSFRSEDVEGAFNTLDASGIATIAGAALKAPVQQGVKQGVKQLAKSPVIDYAKEFGHSIKKGKLPTYESIYRWQPDVFPERLVEAGKTLTPPQQTLTGSWYTKYPGQLAFYMRSRPGAGNVNRIRLSDRQIANLESSMPDYAKGMSGKSGVNRVPTSNTYMPGELIVPESIRSKSVPIRFQINPIDYSPQSVADEIAKRRSKLKNLLNNPDFFPDDIDRTIRNEVIEEHAKNIYIPMLKAQEQQILGIPRKYFPYQGGGSLPKAQNGDELFPGEGQYYNIPEYTFEYRRRFNDLPTPRYTGPLMSQRLIDEATQREYEQRRRAIEESVAAAREPLSTQRLARESAVTGDKFSLQMNLGDPYNNPRLYETLGALDFINPGVMLGDMVTGLGSIPYNVQEGNYGAALLGLGLPLATGALASIGVKSPRQFINNLVNPVAGIGDTPKQLPGSGNVVKKFGLSIDELGTKGIIKKSKDLEKNVDLGIGKYDHTNLVEYDNGLQLHTYSQPGSKVDDVILVYNPKTEENIAYMRNYKIGDDWKPAPTNMWHIKADMRTADKDLVKFANQELEKIVQVKPIKYEGKTISTDGLRYWNQQQKHGYSAIDDFNTPYVSAAGKDDLFKGLKYSNNNDAFEYVKFETKKDATEAAARLENFIKSQGLDYKVIINNDNTLQINLPKLQRAFSMGGNLNFQKGGIKNLNPYGELQVYPVESGAGLLGEVGLDYQLPFGNSAYLSNTFNVEPGYASYFNPGFGIEHPILGNRGSIFMGAEMFNNNPRINAGLKYRFEGGGSLPTAGDPVLNFIQSQSSRFSKSKK